MNEWGETVEVDPGTKAPETQEHSVGDVQIQTDKEVMDSKPDIMMVVREIPSKRFPADPCNNIRGLYVEESSASANSPCRTLKLPRIC